MGMPRETTYGTSIFPDGAERGTMVAVRARTFLTMNLRKVSLLSRKILREVEAYFDQSGYLFPAMMRTSIGLETFSGSLRR